MPAQSKPQADVALMVKTLNTLTEQLTLYHADPNGHVAQAVAATQSELSDLKTEIADMKQMIRSISERTEHTLPPEPVPTETLAEAAKRIMQARSLKPSSVTKLDPRVTDVLLKLLELPTYGTLEARRSRNLGEPTVFADASEAELVEDFEVSVLA